MLDAPWWYWPVAYAVAGAVFGVWELRELGRNEVLHGRFCDLEEALEPLFSRGFTRRMVVASSIMLWPVTVAMITVFDVPGRGKNVRPDERKDASDGE